MFHDDVIKRKHFLRYWPFVWGIHRSPVNSPHKGQWRGALMLSLVCAWIKDWVNNREAGDLSSNHTFPLQNIRRIVEEIVAKEKSDVHLALIEYRDHPPQESSFVTRVHDFTASVKKMKTWLEAASASGGGDGPEAVADAWHALLKLNWRENATKICVHIADAPPHGLGLRGDGFPKGEFWTAPFYVHAIGFGCVYGTWNKDYAWYRCSLYSCHKTLGQFSIYHLWPLLLTWFNFNPSMDK